MAKKKLNSMRLLESRGIAYEIHTYDPAIRDARQVAAAVGLPAETVYKTLVARAAGQGKPVLCLLPCDTTLNLKRLAKALCVKKAALVSHADAEALTGLQVGGISPLALTHKNWRVLLDVRGANLPEIVISGGQRGIQISLATTDLVKLLKCESVDIADAADKSD